MDSTKSYKIETVRGSNLVLHHIRVWLYACEHERSGRTSALNHVGYKICHSMCHKTPF